MIEKSYSNEPASCAGLRAYHRESFFFVFCLLALFIMLLDVVYYVVGCCFPCQNDFQDGPRHTHRLARKVWRQCLRRNLPLVMQDCCRRSENKKKQFFLFINTFVKDFLLSPKFSLITDNNFQFILFIVIIETFCTNINTIYFFVSFYVNLII